MQDLVYNVTRGREGLHEQHWTDQYTEKIRSWYLLYPAYGYPDWGDLSDIWTAVKWRDDNTWRLIDRAVHDICCWQHRSPGRKTFKHAWDVISIAPEESIHYIISCWHALFMGYFFMDYLYLNTKFSIVRTKYLASHNIIFQMRFIPNHFNFFKLAYRLWLIYFDIYVLISVWHSWLNALTQHLQQVNYQSRIWHQCLLPSPGIGTPDENGWCINDDKLDLLWMTCRPALDEVSPKKVDELFNE